MPTLGWTLTALLVCASARAQEPAPRPGTPHPLPPGVYEIRPVHSNLCVTYEPAAGLRVPHVSQERCEGGPPDLVISPQRVQVVPASGGGYFIRVNGSSDCATVARRVIVGPASIDVVACATPPQNACTASAADQIFRLVFIQAGPGTGANHVGDVYEVRTPNNECWDIQAGKGDAGVDVIRWGCNQQANQRFRFKFIAPLQDPASLACARRAGW
jgi:hypothetical protein